MVFSYSASSSTPPTTGGAGVVITIDGGPNATANIPGGHNDPADLYGIGAVLLAIAVVLIAARWLFGRRGGAPTR